MTENVELHTFHTNIAKENDIEEYDEINFGDNSETAASSNQPFVNTLNEHNFFTQHNVKTGSKVHKKKKSKMKGKSTLLDMITAELASLEVPIQENVINTVDYPVEQRKSFLESTSWKTSRGASPFDFEHGWIQKEEYVNLKPVFPRVFENVTSDPLSIHVEYVKPCDFADLKKEINNTEDHEGARFLDIEIKDIKFKHHHNFSLEKLLSIKLNEFYEAYQKLNEDIHDVVKEIKINRETRDNLKQEFLKISPNKKEDIRFDQTVRKYTKALLELKDKYLKLVQTRKEILHKIFSLWADIEMVREKFKHTDTTDVLIVTKSQLDTEEFRNKWNEVFNIEFQDMLDKMEFEYVSKYIEYKEVKYTQNLDDSAKKRISKPKLIIDEDVLKEEVEDIVNSIVLKDKIDVDLIQNQNIKSEEDKLQKSRYINFEIYVDDIRVCESEHFLSKNDNSPDIEFTEALSVQILPNNKTLTIVLKENDKEVSSLKVNLSEIRTNNTNAVFVQPFEYNIIIEPNHEHIGSGHNIKEIASHNKVRLKSSNIFSGNIYTSCDVSLKMTWTVNQDHNQDESVKDWMEVGNQIKRLIHGIEKPSTDLLADIVSKVYNKDVRNEDQILTTLRNLSKMGTRDNDSFPIDENSPEFIRLKLLHLRNSGGMVNIENKTIPIHGSQISTEHLNCLQKSKETDIDVQYFSDKYANMDPIELQRFIGAKYLQKLNMNMLRNLNEHLLRKTHKDVVRDFKDLSLRNIFSTQSNLTLATISTHTKQQLLAEALNQEQEIRVTVVRAFNLPERSAVDEESDEQIAGFKLRSLRPFVRVSYNGVSAQSAVAIGSHPSWSQTISITVKPNPLSTLLVQVLDSQQAAGAEGLENPPRCSGRWLGAVTVPLSAVLGAGSLRGTFRLCTPPIIFGYENKPQANENVQSFVSSVNRFMKKDTSFLSLQISSTLSHLGGLHGYNRPIPNSDDDYLINHLNDFVTAYTNDFPSRNISLTFIDSSGRNRCVTQFLQPIPPPDSEYFPKNPKRVESALSKSSGLSKSSSSRSSGKRREEGGYQGREERESLYSAVSWKNGENQLEKMMTMYARYVALIPSYEVTESHTVTLLGLELLKTLHGSPLDHTLLLASYFLYLGIRCWVAIGFGLPRGPSSFVITKYDPTQKRFVLASDQVKSRSFFGRSEGCVWFVYDAVSGDRSELRDLSCPLKSVDFVFDNENIWVNVQPTVDCESVSFDFTRSSEWQPVFDKSVFVPKLPVIGEAGVYRAPADTERLRVALEARIREKVHKWRPHVKTIWNRYCSSLLREMLPQWEYWSFNPSEPTPTLGQRMKQLMVTYKVFGFPLHVPFASTKSVLARVRAAGGAHVSADPNVELALAVDVFAYPNNVLSVWVFLVNIARV